MAVDIEYIKTLEDQKESLAQTNETLSKNIKQLEISLNDANSALLKVRKDLEESRQLKSKCEEQTSILENKMLKLSETASSMETKEVRFLIFCFQCNPNFYW